MSSVTGEPAAEKPSGRFNLRTVFAVVAGCAFVAFAAKWLMSLDPDLHPIRLGLLIVPWAVGTFVGIAIAGRRHRSTLAAAMVGGSLAATMCPGLFLVYANGLTHLSALGQLLAFAACGSGLLAAVVDIVRQGSRGHVRGTDRS